MTQIPQGRPELGAQHPPIFVALYDVRVADYVKSWAPLKHSASRVGQSRELAGGLHSWSLQELRGL